MKRKGTVFSLDFCLIFFQFRGIFSAILTIFVLSFMNTSHSLILLRGLPGSGKSTLAKVLSEGGKYPVYSIDDYFTDALGNYEFVFSENHKAYSLCQENVKNSMQKDVMKIFVANTFTMDWEMDPYFALAKQFDYKVYVVTVENYHGGSNVHYIPQEHIEKMAAKYKIKLH